MGARTLEWRQKEGVRSPGAGVKGYCELPNESIGNQTIVPGKRSTHCDSLSHLQLQRESLKPSSRTFIRIFLGQSFPGATL